jgi:hypothetical protein
MRGSRPKSGTTCSPRIAAHAEFAHGAAGRLPDRQARPPDPNVSSPDPEARLPDRAAAFPDPVARLTDREVRARDPEVRSLDLPGGRRERLYS